MSQQVDEQIAEFYAQTYDASLQDWPGELDFYQDISGAVKRSGAAVLEIACGTGRVAIRLAQAGVNVVGLDLAGLLWLLIWLHQRATHDPTATNEMRLLLGLTWMDSAKFLVVPLLLLLIGLATLYRRRERLGMKP